MKIKAGDLVVIVGTNCEHNCDIGKIREVLALTAPKVTTCFCGAKTGPIVTATLKSQKVGSWEVPISWLRRIDPLVEHHDVENYEVMTK